MKLEEQHRPDQSQAQSKRQPAQTSGQDQQHSPIRAQYLGVKRQYPDAIVLFRLGDFYELFDDDAALVARELELTLTKREWGRGEKSPMAGFPHHAADGYIARLIGRGYRVAVCEQMSDPALARGLVEREVVRVVTPGTVVDPAMLAAKRNNYLAAAVWGRDAVGVAYVDVTTGEFATTQFAAVDPEAALLQELARMQPAEVLVLAAPDPVPARRGEHTVRPPAAPRRPFPASGDDASELLDGSGADDLAGPEDGHEDGTPERPAGPFAERMGNDTPPDAREDDEPGGLASRLRELDGRLRTVVTPYTARAFNEEVARACLRDQFGVASLEGFGCQHLPLAVRAAGAVVAYLRETQQGALAQLTALETYSTRGFMALDTYTRRNLELFESGRGGGVKGSLLWVLDRTRTPMGGRLLRRWVGEPLLDLAALRQRQAAVATALADVALRARVAPALSRVGDLERLTSRVVQRIATPRDLVALAAGLRAADEVLAL
ncbi:MAG TPA: hypothetical protein VGN32_10575, partial [Ktedonobacterales bacterium]|nr:hypothetical protein [Ktedonobacterales bacterium]